MGTMRTQQAAPRGHLVLLGMWVVLSAAGALAAETSAVAVAVTRNPRGAEIALTWPLAARAVAFRVEGNTLWLRFDRPLGEAPLDTLPTQLPEWIKGIRYGYDTVLIDAARPAHFAVEGEGGTVTITLTQAPPPRVQAPAEDAEIRRIDRLRSLALLEQGELDEAQQLLESLAADAPRDASIVNDLARVAEARGDWRGALNGYRRATAMEAGYEPARQAAARLSRQYGTHVTARTTVRAVQGADRQEITTLDARTLWDMRGVAGLHVEDRHLQIDSVRRASGAIKAVDRHLASAEAWVGHNWADGAQSRVGLLFNPDGTGFRIRHRTAGELAQTEIELLYHQPYFAYVEGIADDAVRDRAVLRNYGPVGKHIRTSLGFSANRYYIAGLDAGNSAGVDAAVHFTPRPGLQLSYALDAEYVDDVTTLPAPGGGVFEPLPITDRQVHAVGMALSGTAAPELRWAAGGGYAWDQYNDNGAFADASLTWEPLPGLELAARAARAISTERGQGSRVHEYGVVLTWRPHVTEREKRP